MNIITESHESDFKNILTGVRHAWRIVAAYQQRLFFLLRQIEAGFPDLTLSYWEPAYTDRPPKGTTKPWNKWNWDFLPLHSTYNWFTQTKTKNDPMEVGDWFMVVTILTDTGFDNEGEESSSFNGPDPMKMDPVEETETWIYLSIYQVTSKIKDITPADIWHADEGNDTEKFEWIDLPDIGSRFTRFGGPLENYMENGAIEILITEIKGHLAGNPPRK